MKSLREVIAALKCDNVLECFFGLNEFDVAVYKTLVGKTLKNQELARFLNRSENAVYKSLQKLIMCGLVLREKRCVDGGGYYYVYRAVNPKQVARKMEKEVEELRNRLMKSIGEFEIKFSAKQ